MKYCKICSSSMSDEAEFCPNCGNRVESGFEPEKKEGFIVENIGGVKKRNIWAVILLIVITCGIYSFYWNVKINDETLELANEKGSSGIMVLLLTVLTCGLYSYYWYYKMGNCVDKIRFGNKGYSGIIYIVLCAVGIGIINPFLIQTAINEAVEYSD